jgi:hypothetical protein
VRRDAVTPAVGVAPFEAVLARRGGDGAAENPIDLSDPSSAHRCNATLEATDKRDEQGGAPIRRQHGRWVALDGRQRAIDVQEQRHGHGVQQGGRGLGAPAV